MTDNSKRCVITGLGMISAIGSSVDECWENALAGKSGIEHTHTVDTENCYADFAAEVKDSTIDDLAGTEGMDRASKLCIKATDEAMADAGLESFNGSDRTSVIMGSCVGGVVSIEHYYTKGKNKEDISQMPISAIASQVAGRVNAGGVVTNVANACAAGTISIAYASELIRSGKADVVLAGGADAFASVPYAGFISLHALDSQPCSPFNHSSGITLGEGAGAVIVESYEHALKRNAKIYCEVLGSGISSDAHHITAPRPDGEGQMNAIRKAIASSGIDASEIGYVNAHGTGTAKNDEAEILSMHTIFDGVSDDLCVSSTKAMTGHCLGAAGAIEAVFSVKALTENTVPPTLGFKDEDFEKLSEKAGKINFCPNTPVKKELRSVMSNSFAFGGNNASIIFSKDVADVDDTEIPDDIYITGLGIVSPLGNGVDKYIENAEQNVKVAESSVSSSVNSEDYAGVGLKMAFYRKLDHFSQLQAVSGMQALQNSGYTVNDDNATDIGIIVGTSEGALAPGCDFEMLVAEKGNASGSAFKFPNTVYNAAGGYLSICSGIKGYNVTVTNGTQSGLASIAYAADVIRTGKEKAMIATGSDENCDIISELYTGLGFVAEAPTAPYENTDKFTLSDGSVSIMLETKNEAQRRGAKLYCKVKGCGMANKSVPFATLKGSDEACDKAINNALNDAGFTAQDIDCIIGFANGHKSVDEAELNSLNRVFGESLINIPVISVKERMGEGRAATAALSCAHGALMLSGDIKKDTNAYLITEGNKPVRTTVESESINRVLAVSYGSGGSYCAVILER